MPFTALFLDDGLKLIEELKEPGGNEKFLDSKLLDSDTTVYNVVESIIKIPLVNLLTVHAYPKTIKVAYQVEKDANSTLQIIGVPRVLEMDMDDLDNAGYSEIFPHDLIEKWVRKTLFKYWNWE